MLSMTHNEDPGVVLSQDALKTLMWIRDYKHHIARILVNGREPTTEPPEAWTHIELKGRLYSRRIPLSVWAETAPYRRLGDNGGHMFDVNEAGLALLNGAGTHMAAKTSIEDAPANG